MLIDEVTIRVNAGNGGKGSVAFNKNAMALGPAGGRGGNGGSVYFEGVSNIDALHNFQYKKELQAEHGENGKAQFNDGRAGDDLVVLVPVGSVIRVRGMRTIREIVQVGERILIAKGGHGGKGNFLFRSPKNTTPYEFQEGLPGERFTVDIELKLIADVGIIGLPNAGKSSLLNSITRADSKVGNYQFTTLEPHLGAYYGLILADIPGLIEGASHGKGLGTKFLRHIERTKVLFHLISAESDDPVRDYETIRAELGSFNPSLFEKSEYVFITKIDLVSPERLSEIKDALLKKNIQTISLSILEKQNFDEFEKLLRALISEKKNG